MTISQSIKQWLYQNTSITIDDTINTELLNANAKSYAISKEPNAIIEKYLDGSQKRIEYYTFFARQNSQTDFERISNDLFLENLEKWVDTKNLEGNLPILDDNQYCDNIGVSSSFYLFETQEEESIYAFTLEITYRREL